jgi:two-component sensor histidine kinase
MTSSVLSRAMKERPRCSAICLRCCLLRMTIWALSAEGCVSVPRMGVGEASATTLAMVVHELATNSLKYGALSAAAGTLDVSCAPPESEVVIVWTERGGPPVSAPAGAGGFGSRLVTRSMTAQLGGSIERQWLEEGVVVTIRISKDRLAS